MLQVLLLVKCDKPMKIVTYAMCVIMGFKLQNRKAYFEARHGDIWRQLFRRTDELEVKPTIHQAKSHVSASEAANIGMNNPFIVERLICSDAADVAVGAYADPLGDFSNILKDDEFFKAQLWQVLKRISAIELHIRVNEDNLVDTAEGIFVNAKRRT